MDWAEKTALVSRHVAARFNVAWVSTLASDGKTHTVRLEIGVGQIGGDEVTPARQQAQVADERLKAAEQAIDADPAVRAMRETFDATVQPGSVRPLS